MKHILTNSIETVVKAAHTMSTAPSPTKSFLDLYRATIGCESGASRAANGGPLSLYGQVGASVPGDLATICKEDCDPVAQAISKWLVDLFLDVSNPFRRVLLRIPMLRKRFKHLDPEGVTSVKAGTISAVAKALMVMFAILVLTAAIFTLNSVRRPNLRILIVALFAQGLALPVQFLSPGSLPLYTLITG